MREAEAEEDKPPDRVALVVQVERAVVEQEIVETQMRRLEPLVLEAGAVELHVYNQRALCIMVEMVGPELSSSRILKAKSYSDTNERTL
jgi:hypothetical protein